MVRKLLVFVMLAAPFAAAHKDFKDSYSETRALRPGAKLHLHWKVGDVRIVKGTDPNNLRIHYTVRSSSESAMKNAKVEFRGDDDDLTIETHSSFHGNTSIDADIEIPDQVNLDVRLKVGDLEVDDIVGDKDLGVSVGDIRVRGGDTPEYRSVHAKTGIGDVDWTPPKGTPTDALHQSGWLGHNVSYISTGKYELRAEVSVGDIQLH